MLAETRRPRVVFSWVLALLLPLFAVYLAVAYPIEESAYDAAAIHIPRSVVFSDARSDGGLIPRWTPELNAGLGSPVFSFYSPMPYLLTDLLNHVGIPHPIGWRVLVALALELAAAGAFGLGLALFGRADVALAGAACYVYAPYLLQEFFERGSPQGMAIALAPWVLWSLLRLWERPSGLRFALAALAWASLVLIHNLTALLFAPVVALLFVYLASRSKTARLVYPMLALLAGTLVAAFHVLPFVIERQFVQLAFINEFPFALPAQNPLLLVELLALPRVYDVLRENNGLGQTVGLLPPVLLLLGLPLAAILWRQQRRDSAILLAGLTVMGLAIVWLQLPDATPVWASLPALNVLQFRWRLLSMLAFAVFAALGYLLLTIPESARKWLAPLLTIAFVAIQLPFLYPQLMHRNLSFPPRPTIADIRELARTATLPGLAGFDEFLPIWRTTPLTEQERHQPATLMADLPAGAQVLQEQRHAQWASISLDTPAAFTAELRMLYYPGWHAYLDGQKQSVRAAPGSGYLSLDVPAGSHSIALRYEGTAAQHAGDWLSLSALMLLVGISLLWRPPKEAHVAAPVYLSERWWIPALFIGLVAVKGLWLDPQTTWLRCASTAGHICGAQVSAGAAFVGGPALKGYSVLSPSVARGGDFRLMAFWEGAAAGGSHLNTFVHLRNSMRDGPINPETGSDIWAQEIHEVPARTLASGRLLMDSYRIRVPEGIPPGRYFLEIGWFDPASGDQLDVDPQSLQQPLRILWRSVLLPDVEVR